MPPGPAVLAIGLAPIRLTGAPERDARMLSGHTLLLRSRRLESLSRRLYGQDVPRTGAIPGIFDYVGSYLRERAAGRASWGSGLRYETHYYPVGAKGFDAPAAAVESGANVVLSGCDIASNSTGVRLGPPARRVDRPVAAG